MDFMERTKKLLRQLVSTLLRQRKTLLLIVVVSIVTLLISSLVSIWLSNVSNLHFPTIGTIRTSGLEAYWNADLTNKTGEILWGHLYPGSEVNVTLHFRSISNVPVTLEMTTANWTFRNSTDQIVYGPTDVTEHMTFSWDYDGSTVDPGQVVPAVLTLRVEYTQGLREYLIEKDVQSFSFDISIRTLEENAQ